MIRGVKVGSRSRALDPWEIAIWADRPRNRLGRFGSCLCLCFEGATRGMIYLSSTAGRLLLSSMPLDQSGHAVGVVLDQIVDTVRHRVGVNAAETDGVHTGRHRRDEVRERRFVARGDGDRRVVGPFGGGVDAAVGGKGAVDRERRPYGPLEVVSGVGIRLVRRAELAELKEVVEPGILAARKSFSGKPGTCMKWIARHWDRGRHHPSRRCREAASQEHRAPGDRGILAGEGICDLAAEIVPDDIDVVELLRLCELVHVLGQGIGVIPYARDAGLSYAPQIQRHHRESLASLGMMARYSVQSCGKPWIRIRAGPAPPLTKCSRTPFTLAMFEVKPGGTPGRSWQPTRAPPQGNLQQSRRPGQGEEGIGAWWILSI